MRAVLTLTTDFGLTDPFVGIMKGMMEMSPDGAAWKVFFEAAYKRR